MATFESDSIDRLLFEASAVSALSGELNMLVDQVEQSLTEHRTVAPLLVEQLHELTATAELLFAERLAAVD